MRRTPRRWMTPVPPTRALRDRDRHRASDRWRARVRTAQGAAPGAPRSQTSGGRRARTPRSDGSIVSTSPIGARAGANAPVASGGAGCRGCCRDRVGRLQFAARLREFGDPGRTGGHHGHVGAGSGRCGHRAGFRGREGAGACRGPGDDGRRQRRSIRRLSKRLRSKWRRGPTDHRGAHRPPAGHPHGGPRGPAFRAARPQRSRHR